MDIGKVGWGGVEGDLGPRGRSLRHCTGEKLSRSEGRGRDGRSTALSVFSSHFPCITAEGLTSASLPHLGMKGTARRQP